MNKHHDAHGIGSEYFVETYDDGRYEFQMRHHVSIILANSDEEAKIEATKLAEQIQHHIYQISTKKGFENCSCAQPIWDCFNGFLR